MNDDCLNKLYIKLKIINMHYNKSNQLDSKISI